MSLREIVGQVAAASDLPPVYLGRLMQRILDSVADRLARGEEVKLRGFGRFHWVKIPERKLHDINTGGKRSVPARYKLRFTPSTKLTSRRDIMSDEDGMDKLGVVLNEDKNKTASEGEGEVVGRICPICAETLDSAGACPKHGTEPMEPGGRD